MRPQEHSHKGKQQHIPVDQHQRLAMDLLEEYEDRLRAGEEPAPAEYLQRYAGPGEDEFGAQLDLATVLTLDGMRSRQNASEMVDSEWVQQAKARLLKRIAELV